MQTFSFDPIAPPEPPREISTEDQEAVSLAELEALRAQAVEEGLAAGRAEAQLAVTAAVNGLSEAAAQLEARLEEEAVSLALAIAERVLAGQLAVEPDRVLEAVRGALRGITDRSRVTVLVNPDDLELVREAAPGLQSTLGGIEHLEIQSERRVGRGGAVVRHPDGDVDAQVATKLERVRELFEAAR